MARSFFLVTLLLASASVVSAQNSVFGKNKVQYKNFEWHFIQTDHFDIYYSQDGYELAAFSANAAEDAYTSIKKLLRYDINNRISMVIHNSHNEFQQTNVIDEYLEEGIGGVTELFKNRIVLPFEGNYGMFRHVIHHELVHAVINDMFYGGTIQSLISSRAPVQLPLWMNEGLAEYAALKWDTNSDMFLRDATIHNYLPPIDYLGGYFAYRGGQSVWYYIANKYGEPKIAEILNRIKGTRSIEQGFKSTIGLSVKELSERWQKEQKVLYWPDVAKREEPEDYAKRLTNHTKDGNFYNTSPAISPQGDKIAFLSDRNDYFDIYLMSAIDGEILDKLVSGQRTKDFEELHLLTPGITWSPDGKKIALAVKAGEHDAIMVVDVESGSSNKIAFDLDGIFSVDWSSDGKKLTFVGTKAPQSDIYVYDLAVAKLTNLTDDIFSDSDPVFSPDARTVYFSSDRKGYVNRADIPADFGMMKFDFSQRDLYAVDVESRVIRRVTDFPNSAETSPIVSPDGKKLLYISDRNGINNIYVRNVEDGTNHPITNSLTGVYQLSLSHDGSKLVFASLSEAGFDIFLMTRPLERKLTVTELETTEYFKRKFELRREEKPRAVVQAVKPSDTVNVRHNVIIVSDTGIAEMGYRDAHKLDLQGYVFSEEAMKDTNRTPASFPKIDYASARDREGNYVPRKYKLNFTPDLVYGNAGYNTFYGLEGTTLMAFSDMLGDHRIQFQTDLYLDLKNSNYGLSYWYLPDRIDYGVHGFHNARFLFIGDTLFRFRAWGLGFTASYPIDKFNRIDFSGLWINLSRDNLDFPLLTPQRRSFLLPEVSYVSDNSLWTGAWFGPSNGSRFNATLYGSPKLGDASPDLQTLTLDYRDYSKFWKDYVFAFRVTGGVSTGQNAQYFLLGGTEGWINRAFDGFGGNIPIVNVEDYLFLTPVLPMRGFNYNAKNGTRFALANFEFRFPLVRYFILGALPVGFQNILGTAFFDIGSAWTDTKAWQGVTIGRSGATVTKDLLMGTGIGARLAFLGLPLRIDVAWRFNLEGFSAPVYYFSLGFDY
ncbi:MAG: PD40 domain-containing protein [Ignavibacteriales bacterium]|nr:PD40 domain-containing protein [Ignavibacteriales bacterium]